jgi:hypothetical protein
MRPRSEAWLHHLPGDGLRGEAPDIDSAEQIVAAANAQIGIQFRRITC